MSVGLAVNGYLNDAPQSVKDSIREIEVSVEVRVKVIEIPLET